MYGLQKLTIDPEEGIRFRGYTIPECLEKLPKPAGVEMPYVEGLVYLLYTGEIPGKKEIDDVMNRPCWLKFLSLPS